MCVCTWDVCGNGGRGKDRWGDEVVLRELDGHWRVNVAMCVPPPPTAHRRLKYLNKKSKLHRQKQGSIVVHSSKCLLAGPGRPAGGRMKWIGTLSYCISLYCLWWARAEMKRIYQFARFDILFMAIFQKGNGPKDAPQNLKLPKQHYTGPSGSDVDVHEKWLASPLYK